MKNETRMVVCFAAMMFACDGSSADSQSPGDSVKSVEQDLDYPDGSIPEPGPWFDKAAAYLCLVPQSHACSDGQVAAIGKALNDGEILVSEAVLEKLQTPVARAYAERLIADHTLANEQLLATGIEPIENAISKALAHDAEHAAEKLASLPPDELDGEFITHHVLDHARALGSLDHLLLPSASSRPLLKVLTKVRAAVSRHTLLAVEAQEQLVGACGGEAPATPAE